MHSGNIIIIMALIIYQTSYPAKSVKSVYLCIKALCSLTFIKYAVFNSLSRLNHLVHNYYRTRRAGYATQGCQITAFLRPNLQQCSLFFFVLGFCFLCLLDYIIMTIWPQKCSDLATLSPLAIT